MTCLVHLISTMLSHAVVHFATILLIVICGSLAVNAVVFLIESLVHIGLYINPRFFWAVCCYWWLRIIFMIWCLAFNAVHFFKTVLIEAHDSLNPFEINFLIRIISYHWYFYLYLVLCSSMGWNCHCESFFVLRVSYHFQFFCLYWVLYSSTNHFVYTILNTSLWFFWL